MLSSVRRVCVLVLVKLQEGSGEIRGWTRTAALPMASTGMPGAMALTFPILIDLFPNIVLWVR